MSILERLTEGVVNRDMRAESHALLTKWKKTGLLEGLESERKQNTMPLRSHSQLPWTGATPMVTRRCANG